MLEIKRFKKPLAYVSVEGKQISRVPGVLARLSTAVAKQKTNIYAMSSGDDDFGMFVLDEKAKDTKKSVEKELERVKTYFDVVVVRGIGMLTVKGDKVLSERRLHDRVNELLSEAGLAPFTIVQTMDNSLKLFFLEGETKKAYRVLTERVKYLVDYA